MNKLNLDGNISHLYEEILWFNQTPSNLLRSPYALAKQSSLHRLLGANGPVRFPSKTLLEVDHDLLNNAIEHTLVNPRTLSDLPDPLVDILEVERRSRLNGEKTKLKPRLFRAAAILGTLSDLIYLIRHDNRFAAENTDILLLIEAEAEIVELPQVRVVKILISQQSHPSSDSCVNCVRRWTANRISRVSLGSSSSTFDRTISRPT